MLFINTPIAHETKKEIIIMNIYRKATGTITMLSMVLMLVLIMARDVRAAITFVYEGQPFTYIDPHVKIFPPFPTSYDKITGFFTLAEIPQDSSILVPVTPTSYDFFDGVQHFTSNDSLSSDYVVSASFYIATTRGQITQWEIRISKWWDPCPPPRDAGQRIVSYDLWIFKSGQGEFDQSQMFYLPTYADPIIMGSDYCKPVISCGAYPDCGTRIIYETPTPGAWSRTRRSAK
jgi:hypothetical protein